MPSFLDAASILLIAGAILYYEGWLFTWLLRRQYAAHFCEIDSPRESFFVIGAWSLNWYPFYILFFVLIVCVTLIGALEADELVRVSLTAILFLAGFYVFHRVTFIRARRVFVGSSGDGFAFFPEVEDLQLSGEALDGTREQVSSALRDGGYRVLSVDRSRLILFSPTASGQDDMMAIMVLPAGEVMAMRVKGQSQFSGVGPDSLAAQIFPGVARWLRR